MSSTALALSAIDTDIVGDVLTSPITDFGNCIFENAGKHYKIEKTDAFVVQADKFMVTTQETLGLIADQGKFRARADRYTRPQAELPSDILSHEHLLSALDIVRTSATSAEVFLRAHSNKTSLKKKLSADQHRLWTLGMPSLVTIKLNVARGGVYAMDTSSAAYKKLKKYFDTVPMSTPTDLDSFRDTDKLDAMWRLENVEGNAAFTEATNFLKANTAALTSQSRERSQHEKQLELLHRQVEEDAPTAKRVKLCHDNQWETAFFISGDFDTQHASFHMTTDEHGKPGVYASLRKAR